MTRMGGRTRPLDHSLSASRSRADSTTWRPPSRTRTNRQSEFAAPFVSRAVLHEFTRIGSRQEQTLAQSPVTVAIAIARFWLLTA